MDYKKWFEQQYKKELIKEIIITAVILAGLFIMNLLLA